MATVYIMQEINPLAAACVCASLVLFFVAAVSPRMGLFVLLLVAAYSDLLKRMLVFWGSLSFEQVSYVLAAGPLVVAGLFVAVITRWAFHRVEIRKRDVLLVLAIGGVMAVNFFLSKRGHAETLEAMKDAANRGLYLMAAPIALKILEEPAEIEKFVRMARLWFIPVAAYGIFQSIFGLADFEIEYLKSGLTIMVKELWDVRPKPFSTLNSAGTFGTLTAAFAVMALYPLVVKSRQRVLLGEKCLSIGLFLLYLAASVVSMVRASLVVWIVALIGLWCFGSRLRTRVFYWAAGASFAALLAASPYLLDHLAEWDPAANAQSEFAGQALRLQTYSERLKGFVNLTRSTEMYSLFGLPEDKKMTETTYNHDPISSLLVDAGIVGLGVAATVLVVGLRFLHKRLLGLPSGPNRDLAVLLIAIDTGWLASHLLFHGVLTSFPVNLFFWLFAGMAGFLLLWTEPEAPETAPDSAASPEPRWARAPQTRPALVHAAKRS